MLASLLFKTHPDAAQPSEVIELLREAVRDVRAVYGDEVETAAHASLKPVRAKAEEADRKLERSVETVLKALEARLAQRRGACHCPATAHPAGAAAPPAGYFSRRACPADRGHPRGNALLEIFGARGPGPRISGESTIGSRAGKRVMPLAATCAGRGNRGRSSCAAATVPPRRPLHRGRRGRPATGRAWRTRSRPPGWSPAAGGRRQAASSEVSRATCVAAAGIPVDSGVLAVGVSPLDHQLLLLGKRLPDRYVHVHGCVTRCQSERAACTRGDDVSLAVLDPQPELEDLLLRIAMPPRAACPRTIRHRATDRPAAVRLHRPRPFARRTARDYYLENVGFAAYFQRVLVTTNRARHSCARVTTKRARRPRPARRSSLLFLLLRALGLSVASHLPQALPNTIRPF
jgi:hypothetical protein